MSGRHEDILNKEKIDFRLGGGAQMYGVMGEGQIGTRMEVVMGKVRWGPEWKRHMVRFHCQTPFQIRPYKGSSAAYLHYSSAKIRRVSRASGMGTYPTDGAKCKFGLGYIPGFFAMGFQQLSRQGQFPDIICSPVHPSPLP